MHEQKDKICKNCKYFYEHYIRGTTQYISIQSGHCSCRKGKKFTKYEARAASDTCEFWEINPETKNDESIKEILKKMRERIIAIENILKD